MEFQTEFPEHCKMFDGHMKVPKQKSFLSFLVVSLLVIDKFMHSSNN